jgi:hypothetical protein
MAEGQDRLTHVSSGTTLYDVEVMVIEPSGKRATPRRGRRLLGTDQLVKVISRIQTENRELTYAKVVKAVMKETGGTRTAVRVAMRKRPERRTKGRPKNGPQVN